jgi:hypothetical protein
LSPYIPTYIPLPPGLEGMFCVKEFVCLFEKKLDDRPNPRNDLKLKRPDFLPSLIDGDDGA